MNGQDEHSVSIGELAGYRLWSLVRKARFFDRESHSVELSGEELGSAWAVFCERHKVAVLFPVRGAEAVVSSPRTGLHRIPKAELAASQPGTAQALLLLPLPSRRKPRSNASKASP